MRAVFTRFFEFILRPIRMVAGFLRQVVPGIKWLTSLKPEILAGVLTFLFLIIIWVAVRFAGTAGDAQWGTQIQESALLFLLVVGISIGVYFFFRVLFAPPKSPFPDIDEAWENGLKELQKSGLKIKDLPIYVVLGLKDAKQIRNFIEGSQKQFDVDGVTGGEQTLIWYANKECVYLFLSGVGNFIDFSTRTRTMPLLNEVEEQDFSSTANISQFYKVSDPNAFEEPEPEEEFDDSVMMSTVRAADNLSGQQATAAKAASSSSQPMRRSEPVRETARVKTGEQRRRLNHLSLLVRQTRTPVSPINGIVIHADVNVLESFPEEMARKLRDDLKAISVELGIVCAATTIVTGLEKDTGFVNFSERLIDQHGSEFGNSKFGKSYRTWTPASAKQMEKVAVSAVEEFDHFVHL
ncbi:MAG: type VI secretion protein IcmF/TssM N-terminal domain-containing protein, partial [Planctomycetota bacterium]